jgi:uncharacterized membrane protein
MIDLLYVSALYLLAIIGGLFLLAIIVLLFICYRYDINININSAKDGKKVELQSK